MRKKLLVMVTFAIGAVLGAAGCPPPSDDRDAGGGGGGSGKTVCGGLNVATDEAAGLVYAWPEGDTYGVNAFYVWELDDASTPEREEYYFASDGTPVRDWVPAKNWKIPPTLWSAIRLALDGLDPHHFSAEDPFYLWYLPYVPGSSWQSKTGARNDGACPESDRVVNGRHHCVGENQLDPNAPSLMAGKTYLLRMMMIIPLGGGENRVQSCYQEIVKR